ncbi:tyrosine-protein phosphatase [Alteromonas aestuariivivens]|uniref:tyrosine-protein phosphatase n=1 Tax=Alteromonas aestuariivivens TaxID=1938339 RepID=UPI001C6A060B|nr:CpsB/CapC family capsule biosynthesis tyrosine phosphatase [Alteromonas aestuariivivens]
MIDLHSHILPGIDDGARSISMSLLMAQQAVDAGVTHMVCTPHIHQGHYDNTTQSIVASFELLQQQLSARDFPLTLSYAAEVRVNELLPAWIRQGEIPFLGHYRGYRLLLLEMPHSHFPVGMEHLVRWLKHNGVRPLVAHPERNREIQRNPELVSRLRGMGCLLQVTAGALTGRFGPAAETLAFDMLEKDKIDVVASDTHDIQRRPNDMRLAYEFISGHHGESRAQRLCLTTPREIITGQLVYPKLVRNQPQMPREKFSNRSIPKADLTK